MFTIPNNLPSAISRNPQICSVCRVFHPTVEASGTHTCFPCALQRRFDEGRRAGERSMRDALISYFNLQVRITRRSQGAKRGARRIRTLRDVLKTLGQF